VRVHRLFPAVVGSHLPSRARLAAVGTVCAIAAVAAPVTVLVTAGSAAADTTGTTTTISTALDVPALTQITLTVPPTVTKGHATRLTARLTMGPLTLAGRTVRFVARAPGATAWGTVATVQTDRNGAASVVSQVVTRATEFGAYYFDVDGIVHSNTATAIVHTIDMTPNKTAVAITTNTSVTIAGHLLKDGVHGIASMVVKVSLRGSSKSAWSAPISLRTNSYGVAMLAKRFSRTMQVGIRFPGASGIAASPLAIVTVTVKPAASTSGFVFPFANPRQAEPMGNWSQDQGIDLAASGYACGASAILVAVGDGVVIQEGIQGFGPTAPVIRMSSGPFRGRNVYYGHTGHVYVSVGAHVRAGQRLAQIGCGSVGYSSAPHLEIGVGVPGGPPCCPGFGQTSGSMLTQLKASLRAALS
jgi:hypothetical protein